MGCFRFKDMLFGCKGTKKIEILFKNREKFVYLPSNYLITRIFTAYDYQC